MLMPQLEVEIKHLQCLSIFWYSYY